MKKLLLILMVGGLFAQSELEELKQQVLELEKRVAYLEEYIIKNAPIKEDMASEKELWKDVSNWKKLKKNMSQEEVEQILGKPHNIKIDSYYDWETWRYGLSMNDLLAEGEVRFNLKNGKVKSWKIK